MKQGILLLYQGFLIGTFCIAVALFIYMSRMYSRMEANVDRAMYQQHVLTCGDIR